MLIAGTFVIVEDGHSDQYGGTSRAFTRVDVRSAKRLSLAGYGCQIDYTARSCTSGTTVGELGMTSSGAGAYELMDLSTNLTTLQAFSPAGVFTKLTDFAIDDLRVTSMLLSIDSSLATGEHVDRVPELRRRPRAARPRGRHEEQGR